MKKVFDSFYVFSKFSLSFILLLCVFFLIYLLYTNYQNEDEVSKLQIELENELRGSINENSKFIKNISKEILETKTALTNIEKLIKENSNKESKVDLTSINESIELLNRNFNSLSYEISSIKNKNIELLDTRKTIPGMRYEQKYATSVGGAKNHRFDLSDGLMIKDNHIAVVEGLENFSFQKNSYLNLDKYFLKIIFYLFHL